MAGERDRERERERERERVCENGRRTFLRILDGDHLRILDEDQISARGVVLLPRAAALHLSIRLLPLRL
jgi:hypothetical protein